MRFYSIKNKFNDVFNPPFMMENDKSAIYQLRIIFNSKKKDDVIIAGDYSCYYVGEFDTDTGTFIPCQPLLLVEDCSNLLIKEE